MSTLSKQTARYHKATSAASKRRIIIRICNIGTKFAQRVHKQHNFSGGATHKPAVMARAIRVSAYL